MPEYKIETCLFAEIPSPLQEENKNHAVLEVGPFWEKKQQETNIIESNLDGLQWNYYKRQHKTGFPEDFITTKSLSFDVISLYEKAVNCTVDHLMQLVPFNGIKQIIQVFSYQLL